MQLLHDSPVAMQNGHQHFSAVSHKVVLKVGVSILVVRRLQIFVRVQVIVHMLLLILELRPLLCYSRVFPLLCLECQPILTSSSWERW